MVQMLVIFWNNIPGQAIKILAFESARIRHNTEKIREEHLHENETIYQLVWRI